MMIYAKIIESDDLLQNECLFFSFIIVVILKIQGPRDKRCSKNNLFSDYEIQTGWNRYSL